MITIGANGKRIAYGIKHYNLDTEADLEAMPTTAEYMGCTAFIIETSKYYMLNSDRKWIEITPFGKATSSSGGGGEGEDPTPDDVIYDGGNI